MALAAGGGMVSIADYVRYSPLIFTYSAVRSQVQTVASPPPPVPRCTSIDTSVCFSARPPAAHCRRAAARSRRAGRRRRARWRDRRRSVTPDAAGRGDDAAPVRVGAVHGRLHERRVGDGLGHAARVGHRARVAHGDGDQLGGALAAADDADRQLARHLVAGRRPAPGRAPRRSRRRSRPDAIANTQSLVEHSPSTVMALNVSSADARSARCSSAGDTFASVVRKPSMVAMFGSIIPEPLAVPPTVNVPRGVFTVTACSFGKRVGGHDGARHHAAVSAVRAPPPPGGCPAPPCPS